MNDTYEYLAWRDSAHHREEAWALSLGFDSASDYWAATNEAFAESIRPLYEPPTEEALDAMDMGDNPYDGGR